MCRMLITYGPNFDARRDRTLRQLGIKHLSIIFTIFVLFSWGIALLIQNSFAGYQLLIWLPMIVVYVLLGIYCGILIRRLHMRACTDSLTGLYNRKYLYELLAKEIGRLKRTGAPLSMLMIDVDNFKQVNDNYGHLTGDKVLVNLTRIFTQNSRTIDIVARWGGEEFVVILPETGLAGAGVFAERLRQHVEAENSSMGVTISLGVAVFRPEYTLEEFVAIADDVLYQAKQTKNCVICFDQAMAEEAKIKDTIRQPSQPPVSQALLLKGLNQMLEVIMHENDYQAILDKLLETVCKTLDLDRALIYKTNLNNGTAAEVCCWSKPEIAEKVPLTKEYRFDDFPGLHKHALNYGQYIESHTDNVHPMVADDGLEKLIHQERGVKSLIWYPFMFASDGYLVLTIHQLSSRRVWHLREVEFLKMVTMYVEIAYQKVNLLAALGQKESRYNSLVQQLSEGIFVLDPKTQSIREANECFFGMTGFTKEELDKLRIRDLILWDKKVAERIHKSMLQEGCAQAVVKFRRKDNTSFNAEMSVCKIVLDGSEVCLTCVRNISSRIKTETSLRDSLNLLELTLKETVNAIASMSEKKDPYTFGHQTHAAHLATCMAVKLGVDAQRVNGISIAARLHDIGKIHIPTDILNKPGILTEMEMGIIKSHSQIGYEILQNIPFQSPVADIILQHHERLDGSGYPKGLTGRDILLEAKILAVADVVEAMSSHRPYRPAIGLKEALLEIESNKGTLYDKNVVDTCLSLFKLDGYEFEQAQRNLA